MNKTPLEMSVEEIEAAYGKAAEPIANIAYVLSVESNTNRSDLYTIEVITDDFRHLRLRFTYSALQCLVIRAEGLAT